MKLTKRTLAWIARGYIALGAFMALAYLVGGDDVRQAVTLMSMLVVLPAAWIANRVHKFPRSILLGLGAVGGLYFVGDVIGQLLESETGHLIVDAIDTLANLLIMTLVGYAASRRRGRFTVGEVLDGFIIGLGAWLVSWILLVQPYLDGSGRSTLGLLLNALYLPVSVLLLVMAAIFVFSARRPRSATWLIIVSLVLNIGGDFVYALEETRGAGIWAFTMADILYIATFALTGAAFVHPTASDLVSESLEHGRLKLPGRMVITSIALIAPIMVLAIVPANSSSDRIVRAASALTLMLLVGGRLFQSTKSTLHSQDELIEIARRDDLTGLPNKSAVLADAEDVINSVWQTDVRPSLYLFDLDRFKNINDSLGHDAGDEVLHVIADRLLLAAGAIGATVARPSGDEFLVFDPTPKSSGEALAHAQSLHLVFEQPLAISAGVLFVTASVGVAAMPVGRPLSGAELFRWADIAMYRAKDNGRNCVALYDESMQERVSQRMKIETDLHGALDRREFRLFHQPIVDVATGRVTGFEALIRWQREDGSMMSPVEFIPIAEETGIITGIGSWALLEALTQLRTWTRDGVVPPDTTVSVNVSPRQLADPQFTDVVKEALRRSGLPPSLLWLEVTESMMIENPDLALSTLERIRALGVRIALDDFGTGYSSLSLLQQFPLQRIKIDRLFVSGIVTSENDRALVRTIIGMGTSMGLDIVAEGVETVQQLKMLRELGCPGAQGFLISHPVPAEAMKSTIAALEHIAQWPEFSQILGGAPLTRSPLPGT